jgi:hypothetical protein
VPHGAGWPNHQTEYAASPAVTITHTRSPVRAALEAMPALTLSGPTAHALVQQIDRGTWETRRSKHDVSSESGIRLQAQLHDAQSPRCLLHFDDLIVRDENLGSKATHPQTGVVGEDLFRPPVRPLHPERKQHHHGKRLDRETNPVEASRQ